jgi:hypothetical protein
LLDPVECYYNYSGPFERHATESGDHGEADEDETDFLVRVGVLYKFRLGERFRILPALNVDFVDGESVYVWSTPGLQKKKHLGRCP